MAEKKETPKVELVEIATQTGQAFKLPTGEITQLEGLILFLANEILEIKKAVA